MKTINFIIAGVALSFLVTGCSTTGLRPVSTTSSTDIATARELMQKQKEDSQPAAPTFTEKLEPLTKDLQKEPQLYALVFQAAPIGDVLTALTKDSTINLIVEDGVDLTKQVTVNLKNVTLKEALDMAVTQGAGYSWTMENEFLHIKKFEEPLPSVMSSLR